MINEAVINEFIAESREHLDATERDLLAMERDGAAAGADAINGVFRAIHSIKGASGTFGFNAVMELSHAMENVLIQFRNGAMTPDGDKINALLDGVDKLSCMINDLASSESVPYQDELRRLNDILKGGNTPSLPPPRANNRNMAPVAVPHAEDSTTTIRVKVEILDMLMNLAGELVLGRNQLRQALEGNLYDNPRLNGVIQNVELVTCEIQEHIMQLRMQPLSNMMGKLLRLVRDLGRRLKKDAVLVTSGGDVELDRSILEGISDPLVHLIRNSMDHGVETPEERTAAGKPRVAEIRLRAFHEGGQVNIIIEDDGRGIDPEQMASKAVSDGIITVEAARRMSEQEKLHLVFLPGFTTARVATGVSGRGVGMDVVRTNIEKLGGHIEFDSFAGVGTTIRIRLPLTLAIIPSLIVGASTERFAVPQVNVKELVCIHPEDIARRIETIGDAPVLRLRERLLPLVRLTDILGLERRFLDPSTGRLVPERRVKIADRRTALHGSADGHPPGDEPERRADARGRRRRRQGDIFVAVLRVGENLFGLIVDELFDIEEIVVKPLSNHIKDCPCFAGATIMGDGRVVMILDASGIAGFAKLRFSEFNLEARRRQKENARAKRPPAGARWSAIIFNNASEEYFALPLANVSRLEAIDPKAVERIGRREFITYRGMGLPLIRLEKYLPVRPFPAGAAEMYIVIPKADDRFSMGIIASRIIDNVETDAPVLKAEHTPRGFAGSAVIGGQIVMIPDIAELSRMYCRDSSTAEFRPSEEEELGFFIESSMPGVHNDERSGRGSL